MKGLNTVICRLIAQGARRAFSQSMQFEAGLHPCLPVCNTPRPRLLYIHIPFCEQLCPYCSFNRVRFEESLCRDYFAALRQELCLYKERSYDFGGIYVGGGTPTILMDELEETLETAKEYFSIGEISVETNPNHLTPERIAVLQRVGVNRLSVGIQSFDDNLLRAMGRYEKYGSGATNVARLQAAAGYFDTLNADMIFNFPIQSDETLDRDLTMLLGTGVDQITYYPLMVSDLTRSVVEKTLGIVDYRKERRMYQLISERLIPDYRFSSAWCFSRKESMIDEYIVDYDEYAGVGSGSIGYMNGICYANTFNLQEYSERLKRNEIPLMASREFSLRDRIRYDFIMKLFGLEMATAPVRAQYGGRLIRYLWSDIAAFMMAGGLRYHRGTFYLTDRGRYYWVIMMREFFTAVNNFRAFCLG